MITLRAPAPADDVRNRPPLEDQSPGLARTRRARLALVERDPKQALIAAHPAFAHCSRREMRQIAKLSDLVEIDRGAVLWRQGHIGYWFLAIATGVVELRRAGAATVEVAGPGAHLGAEAIIGFGPHALTATVRSPVVALVVGRRELLDLVDRPALRAGIGLPRDPVASAVAIRAMRAEASAAWQTLPKRHHPPVGPQRLPASFHVHSRRRPQVLVPTARLAPADAARRQGAPPPTSRFVTSAMAAAAVLVVLTLGLYHPPVAVAVAAEPVDVLRDIVVEGAAEHPVAGRYLLLPVEFDRPTLVGLAVARARGRDWVAVTPEDERGAAARIAAREAFTTSRDLAVKTAIAAAGLPEGSVQVTIRDRQLSGPSAGLVYALAVRDLLDEGDATRGRTIAATGMIDAGGRVSPVWFIPEKRASASAATADVMFVPAGQQRDARGGAPAVVAVATVDEARSWLVDGR